MHYWAALKLLQSWPLQGRHARPRPLRQPGSCRRPHRRGRRRGRRRARRRRCGTCGDCRGLRREPLRENRRRGGEAHRQPRWCICNDALPSRPLLVAARWKLLLHNCKLFKWDAHQLASQLGNLIELGSFLLESLSTSRQLASQLMLGFLAQFMLGNFFLSVRWCLGDDRRQDLLDSCLQALGGSQLGNHLKLLVARLLQSVLLLHHRGNFCCCAAALLHLLGLLLLLPQPLLQVCRGPPARLERHPGLPELRAEARDRRLELRELTCSEAEHFRPAIQKGLDGLPQWQQGHASEAGHLEIRQR
mmetsp:Transcript_255/g.1096  ORF Transcript_255/g.1096 Transcript_255/m.1096 type:complete len:304 (-) Transcript_255:467-1378(-)